MAAIDSACPETASVDDGAGALSAGLPKSNAPRLSETIIPLPSAVSATSRGSGPYRVKRWTRRDSGLHRTTPSCAATSSDLPSGVKRAARSGPPSKRCSAMGSREPAAKSRSAGASVPTARRMPSAENESISTRPVMSMEGVP